MLLPALGLSWCLRCERPLAAFASDGETACEVSLEESRLLLGPRRLIKGPPSPGRTRSGRAYGTDQIHCLDPFDTHLAPEDVNVHTAVVGVGQNGHPKCFVGKGWVPYTDAIAEVWPDVRPRTIQGESRVWAQAIWGW